MKLNPDCVRDTLLYLEENLFFIHKSPIENRLEHNTIGIFKLTQEVMSEYNHEYDETLYAIEKLLEINYAKCEKISYGTNKSIISCDISDITFEGHNFLNTVRPQNVWNATVKGAKKIGSLSIYTLTTLAMEIMKCVVTNPAVIQDIIQNMGK